ncbi:acyl-CoA dehydrogenase C-terminal domain-containing protein, partial [bacterium]|nr:acyl-CoA dehydrogenase C-terminal domain-containing protein [bacterium]
QEILFAANPSFYYYLMSTIETARIIDRFGDSQQKKNYCEKLLNGTWAGALSFSEERSDYDESEIRTKAVIEKDYYRISGSKSFIIAGDHDLTENIIHLVLAKLEIDGKNQLAVFIVPTNIQLDRKQVSNNVSIETSHQTMGLRNTSFSTIRFGDKGECKGFLLKGSGYTTDSISRSLNGIRLQIALQGVALSGNTYYRTLHYACQEISGKSSSDNTGSLIQGAAIISYPHIADSMMFIKALSEGIRGAVYSIAFFNDCSIHGGEEQKEFFSDLIGIYTRVLKVHATDSALRVIKKGMNLIGRTSYFKELTLEQDYRDIQAGTLFAGVNEVIAQEFLELLFNVQEEQLLKSLLTQFNSIDVHLIKSEPLTEAVAVWQDYIGGMILLTDDLKNTLGTLKGDEKDPRQLMLYADRILRLFGDVIICYHLICQGMEAEKKLEKANINFFNLHQEAYRDSITMKMYNKLIAAEFFALNVLSEHESSIRIIQKGSSSALNADLRADIVIG